jgi:hypothetical protein
MKNELHLLKERFFLKKFLLEIEKESMISVLKMNYEIYEAYLFLILDILQVNYKNDAGILLSENQLINIIK